MFRVNPNRSFDLLLQAVERGSLTHIEQLAREDRWPTDLSQTKRALAALLGQLKAEDVPIRSSWRSVLVESEHKKNRRVIGAISFGLQQLEGLENDAETKPQVYAILQPNLTGLISWTWFFARTTFRPTPDTRLDIYPTHSQAAYIFHQLLLFGLTDDTENPLLPLVVHRSLDIWLFDPLAELQSHLKPFILTDEQYTTWVGPILNLLRLCVTEDTLCKILVERMNACQDKTWQKRLVQSFTFRCTQCIEVQQQTRDPDRAVLGLRMVLALSQTLSGAYVLNRELMKSQFSAWVLGRALDMSISLSRRGEVSAAVGVASMLFQGNRFNRAIEVVHVLPAVLKTGYLKVIIQDLLSPQAPGSEPFSKWPFGNPLKLLSLALYHPRAWNAFAHAVDLIPEPTLAKLKLNSEWMVFQASTSPYAEAHRDVLEKGNEAIVLLCDNMKHHEKGAEPLIAGCSHSIMQCSRCKSNVYCSPECQKEDWAIHKDECAMNRIRRIDLQADSAWISHRTRARMLKLIGTRLQNRIDSAELLHSPGLIPFMDGTKYPPGYQQINARSFRGMQRGGRPIFNGRSEAMFDLFADKSDQFELAAFKVELGQYYVIALALFRSLHAFAQGEIEISSINGSKRPEVQRTLRALEPLTVYTRYFNVYDYHVDECRTSASSP